MAGSDTVTEALTLAVQDEARDAKAEVDDLVKHDVDSTDSQVRYLAYGARLRTALRAGQRYIAYVSAERVAARQYAEIGRVDERCR